VTVRAGLETIGLENPITFASAQTREGAGVAGERLADELTQLRGSTK